MVNVGEDHLQKLVSDDGTAISKPKQRMISEHCAHSHHASMKEALVTQCTEGLMKGEGGRRVEGERGRREEGEGEGRRERGEGGREERERGGKGKMIF